MAQPTAPFHEEAVRSEILSHLSRMPHVTASLDPFGNVHATYKRGDHPMRWVFCAHMDHPAYVGSEFKGGVPQSYLDTQFPLKNFGAFSMWDLPAFELADGCIRSRACDDLIGCASILAALQTLTEQGVETTVGAVFTRAEEVGLLGAAYIARAGLLPAGAAILSLETSSERPPAQMHQGVIVRVGDKFSVFTPSLTAELCALALREGIPMQRCLMSGGTCEATAFQAFGQPSAGICVALGNYHNCGPGGRIDSEFVSVSDVESMVRLCVAAALQSTPLAAQADLRTRLEAELDAVFAKN